MDFLTGVNRMLRSEGILRDDDDELTSFTTTAFAASLESAKIAIQDEMSTLIAMDLIPYEKKDWYLWFVDGQREYSLVTGFVRMQDPNPFLLKIDSGSFESEGSVLHEWPGGEENLRRTVLNYREASGKPGWFYFPGGAATPKTIAFYPVPDATVENDYYRYYYESSQSMTSDKEEFPFANEETAETFIRLAASRFRYLRTDPATRRQLYPGGVSSMPDREDDMATLQGLLRTKPPTGRYGTRVV